MQLMNARSDIKTNVSNRVNFGISKDSAKLFSMLSSSLYSNKEKAVMYEIGANCNDAHILAGIPDRPWDLTMPTNLDPYIRFRDFGPGLSEDDVYRLLTTYGESSKSNSNEFIGAFGLGSKSPAAVTSTWNVISRFGGKLKEYFIVVDSNGIPSLSKIREEDISLSDTGLEVVIPVNPNRIFNWTSIVREVYDHYAVKPNVKNFTVDWFTPPVKIQSGTGWYMTKYTSYGEIKFITTQREYSVDVHLLKREFKSEAFLKLFDLNIFVEFPIGELETSLSREQIQYTKHTLASIKKRLTIVYNEFMANLNAHLDVATDKVHYVQLIISASKELFGVINNRCSMILPFIEGNKYGITSENDLSYASASVDVNEDCRLVFRGKTVKLTVNSTCWKSYAIGLIHCTSQKNMIQLKYSYLDRILIVLDDTKNTSARIKHNLPDNHYALIVKSNFLPKEFQKFVVKASSLSAPPKKEVFFQKKRV